MSSIKPEQAKKLAALKNKEEKQEEESFHEAIPNLGEILDSLDEDLELVGKFVERAKINFAALEKAKLFEKTAKELRSQLPKLKPEIRQQMVEIGKLTNRLLDAGEKEATLIKKDLRAAEVGLKAVQNHAVEALAVSFGFESLEQVQNILSINQLAEKE